MTLQRKSQLALNISLFSYLATLVLMICTSLPSNQAGMPSLGLMLGVKLIPLLIVLPGLLLDKLRAHIWLCFIILFYFTRAVVDAFLSEGSGIDLIISVLTVALFLASMYFVKWQRALGHSL